MLPLGLESCWPSELGGEGKKILLDPAISTIECTSTGVVQDLPAGCSKPALLGEKTKPGPTCYTLLSGARSLGRCHSRSTPTGQCGVECDQSTSFRTGEHKVQGLRRQGGWSSGLATYCFLSQTSQLPGSLVTLSFHFLIFQTRIHVLGGRGMHASLISRPAWSTTGRCRSAKAT